MKRVKKMIALVLAVVMTMSVVTVSDFGTTTVKAENIFTITSPTADSLVAAGYIDINWTDASSEGTVSNYSVFINGKVVATTTELTYEYYTTKVNYHTAWIRANYTDGTYAFTPSIRFGVSKKGLGLATDMGANLDLKGMDVAWYYNWGKGPSTGSQYEGIEYVPMVWSCAYPGVFNSLVQNFKSQGYKYVLTFNEPDLQGQCDMTVDEVYNVWKGIAYSSDIMISSPVTAIWPTASSWFKNFMKKVDTNGDYKPDFISIHCYADNYGGAGYANFFLEDVVDACYEKYGLPIWVTEFSTSGNSITATGGNGTKEFWENVMPGLDEREYVVRYAAFGFNASTMPHMGLWNYSTGALTEGGMVYDLYGNPTTDLVEGTATNPGATQKGNKTTNSGENQNVEEPETMNRPHKGKISKLKNVKGKKVKVTFKKIAGATGYQIRYCDNKKFNGYLSKTTKKLKITIKKLEKGTKYYFKVRAYVKTSSGKVTGKWSKPKKIKITK